MSYNITIYDSDSTSDRYEIDELRDCLHPALQCNFPCLTCEAGSPSYCTGCLTEEQVPDAPGYLHQTTALTQTCVGVCPPGYSSSGTRDPPRCLPCADTCETCEQENDRVGDVDLCRTCKPEFPYLWERPDADDASTCHSDECPPGSWKSNSYRCQSCQFPCQFCSDDLTCTKCDALSDLPYLFEAQCHSECPYGYTPIDNECVKCQAPCATCAVGQVNACLACDNTDGEQFLYGTSCLTQCPVNTTLDLAAEECKECDPGCEYCDPEAAWVCLICAEGLALLDSGCLAECPRKYLKSPDGSTCEPRTYPLDDTFIAFPVLGAASFFVLITLASYWLTGHRSLVSSSLIAFFGPIEMGATLYQFLYTLVDDRRDFVPIRIGSICVFCCGVILNLVFIVHFHKQVKGTDKEFERWRKRKWCASNCCLFMAGGCSLTLYRLIYCRIFRLQSMSVRLSRPQPFLRPILMFTWIKFLIFNIPLIIVDLVGTAPLAWGNQCYMTMVESCVLSFCSLILMLWETVKRKELIRREGKQLTLEKMELLDETDMDRSYTKTSTFGGLG